jgi:hypothetical protein
LLARLQELNLPIELDPPDMSEELRQALQIRSRYQLGCYGLFLGLCAVVSVIYALVAFVGGRH